ncbi:inositol monophosphatase [Mycetocola tolaasinivorans]|uniref:Inositol monophosphatase n=2 Tax=Mycetocola tolaasinivorans TaxID=76635 RepID=A0A3L6ZZI1_9MICO|nr:inositol monophosphatase [Mycetocola tolaasinivorans]
MPDMSAFRQEFSAMENEVVAMLRPALSALNPDAAWLDELAPTRVAGDAWLVDSVDGAVQYMRGLPQWCLTATLVRDGEAVLTVLHNPVLSETYAAALGAGAWRNGRPVSPAATEDVGVALVATSQPPFAAAQPEAVALAGASLSRALGSVGAVRNLGPTSWQIADVASGRLDAFWEHGDDRSNLLGATLIARESGTVVTDLAGVPWTPESASILVAAPALHAPLLGVLSA